MDDQQPTQTLLAAILVIISHLVISSPEAQYL